MSNDAILITCALGVLSFFGVRLVNGMDALRKEASDTRIEMSKLMLIITEKFATKEEVDSRIEESEDAIHAKMEICKLRHSGSVMKEVG